MLLAHDTGQAPHTGKADAILKVRGLTKFFHRADKSVVPAVDDISMDVHAGEFVVLLGPSGCGKTTLLRCIGGLERPDQGEIEIDGRTVFSSERRIGLMPEERGIGMVFQSYALWPHMTVFDNVAYPLRARKVARGEIAGRVHEALAMVGIPELAQQYAAQMSGGQQQRVALARAIVARSRLVLFDEPLSNVDAKVREQLRDELIAMQRKMNFAAVYVTHDQDEAMALAHRIAALNKGKVAQIGTPRDLYLTPRSLYVANFVGTTNAVAGTIAGIDNGLVRVATAFGELQALPVVEGLASGNAVSVVFRPERCSLTQAPVAGHNRLAVTLVSSTFLGAHTQHLVRSGAQIFSVWTVEDLAYQPGSELWLCGQPELFCALASQ